ncbi:hypothetical protein BDK51DRAFT_44623 [Blyttiomyces helicus]|uniref:Uncharacterized protein n=1 Tax=Blyttiomyces helicus TaxID=388810 RepID=A0A4P9WDA5_9FUNG|nr:hypothetical protein BDK51DRAFT_44623 [Blyttiomyces helicus]|eukprot:RKO89685.1 hypothetical protein BDK51DRAFT_44623 [Blyttiomyces helicus]
MSSFTESPTVPSGRQNQQPPLLELVNLSNKLVLDNVYLNGLHALRRFELRNISPYPLTVKLRSNLGSQVAFQLTNENLPDRHRERAIAASAAARGRNKQPASLSLASSMESDLSGIASTPSSPPPEQNRNSSESSFTSPSEPGTPVESVPGTPTPFTTNTAAAAAIGVFGTENGGNLSGHQFNQLFNYVNHIDEVDIAPGCTQKIIVAFLPEERGRGRKRLKEGERAGSAAGAPPGLSGMNGPGPVTGRSAVAGPGSVRDDTGASESPFVASNEEDETYDFFEVNGLLFLFAYRAGRKKDGGDPRRVRSANESEDAPDVLNEGDDLSALSVGVCFNSPPVRRAFEALSAGRCDEFLDIGCRRWWDFDEQHSFSSRFPS